MWPRRQLTLSAKVGEKSTQPEHSTYWLMRNAAIKQNYKTLSEIPIYQHMAVHSTHCMHRGSWSGQRFIASVSIASNFTVRPCGTQITRRHVAFTTSDVVVASVCPAMPPPSSALPRPNGLGVRPSADVDPVSISGTDILASTEMRANCNEFL